MPYKNKEDYNANQRDRYWRNVEKSREYNRKKGSRLYAANREERVEYHKKWRAANRGKALKATRKYGAAHVVERREYSRHYAKKHPEVIKAASLKRRITRSQATRNTERAWRSANSDRVKVYDKNKRAKRAGAMGRFTKAQWMNRCELYGWRCAYCGCALTKRTVQIEHIKPLSKGGSNWPSNLVPACRPCNSRKATKRLIPINPIIALRLSRSAKD